MNSRAICLITLLYPIVSILGSFGGEREIHNLASLPDEAASQHASEATSLDASEATSHPSLPTQAPYRSQYSFWRPDNNNRGERLVQSYVGREMVEDSGLIQALRSHVDKLVRFHGQNRMLYENNSAMAASRQFLVSYFQSLDSLAQSELHGQLQALQKAPLVKKSLETYLQRCNLPLRIGDFINFGSEPERILRQAVGPSGSASSSTNRKPEIKLLRYLPKSDLPERIQLEKYHNHEIPIKEFPNLPAGEITAVKVLDEGDICPICQANFDPSKVISPSGPCGHYFHNECIESWLTKNPTCPLCRGEAST